MANSSTKTRKTRETFGAIRRLPSGRIQASYTDPAGTRRTAPHTFDTMTDARGWLSTQRAKLHTGEWSAMDADRADTSKKAAAETFGTYAADWLVSRMNSRGEPLRPRSRVEYERLLAGPLAPLAGMRLRAITPQMMREWYDSQIADGKRTQAARAYSLAKAILATAVEDGKITTNPCRVRGAANAVTGRKITPPTSDELKVILDRITPRYRAAVVIAAWAGARFGEMTELRRKDVVIVAEGGTVINVVLNVNRAVTHTAATGFIVGRTKSDAGVRSIVLPPHVHDIVVDHLGRNVAGHADSLLFPAGDGIGHLAQSTLAKHWYPARRAAGRDDLPWHGLRHHGATRAALAGATLAELKERLGHSTTAAAMRYQHTAGRDAELAARMSALALA